LLAVGHWLFAIDNRPMARIAVLTASDKGAAGEREDVSGQLIEQRARAEGHEVVRREVVPDDRETIARYLREWCDAALADLILTTGGTGLTPRDVTPEATRDVAEREVPALPIALALSGLEKTPYAALTRGVAVTRGKTLIVNLPGSPKAVDEGLAVVMPLVEHIAELLAGPVEH
jgi:molybdopterin adenylyltransferase